jgi:nicotinate-nucleotide adenylyltransferase
VTDALVPPHESLAVLRRVGVYGGSFDPVHVGHLHAADAAGAAHDLELVVFVPARLPPHKTERRLASGAERVAMLRLALAARPRCVVSELELARPGRSYTVDTLRLLPEVLGLRADCELFLIVGDDNLADLPRWREGARVLRLARPVVVAREPARLEATLAALEPELDATAYARLRDGVVRAEPVVAAATELRSALGRGEDPGAALPPGVLEYVRARGLYGSGPA